MGLGKLAPGFDPGLPGRPGNQRMTELNRRFPALFLVAGPDKLAFVIIEDRHIERGRKLAFGKFHFRPHVKKWRVAKKQIAKLVGCNQML